MVGTRRFGPLIVAVLLGYGVVGMRLYDVQVEEHEAWSREARNLVRAATFVPHKRGSILDRTGLEIVRDEELYEIEFTWRDFRRGHPLGQVVQVRSLLLLRPVPLVDAWYRLEEWALDLVELSPAEIDGFGRGKELSVGGLHIQTSSDPEAQQRWTRRGHLHFYVKALLDVDRREAKALAEEREGPQGRRPYLERVAALRSVDPGILAEELVVQLTESRSNLSRLASLIDDGAPLREPGIDPLERLIERLEAIRRGVEDDAADDLFAKAHGFGAWRLDERNLAHLDLDWLARSLFWDGSRLSEWAASRGASWRTALERLFAGPTIARFKVEVRETPAPTRILNAFADVFADPGGRTGMERAIPTHWRGFEGAAVLAQGERWQGGERVRRGLAPTLPVEHESLRENRMEPEAELIRALALTELLGDPERRVDADLEYEARRLAAALVEVADAEAPTFQPEDLELVAGVLHRWNELLQARIEGLLVEVSGTTGRAVLREEWVESALEERAYVVRDRSSRPRKLRSEPGDDLVQLVTRYPREYAGFGVRATTRRVPVVLENSESAQPLAHLLLGQVRAPYMTTLLRQWALKLELERLQQKRVQSEEDEPRIKEIVREVYLPGEFQGGSGIEAYFDVYLRGENGYRETRGLQDKRDGGREPLDVPPQDGLDLRLTLDVDLQRAAQYVLEHPAPVPASDDKPDRVWWQHPVGALVLVTPDGDILAAASTPLEAGVPGPGQDGERAIVRERTLDQPKFHPPGSVFKPFVAAWALEYHGLDPIGNIVPCDGRHGHARYGSVRCWRAIGHGERVDLGVALEHSCNCYFAWLGESLPDQALRDLAGAFGFGRPTGVRLLDEEGVRPIGLQERPNISGALAGTDPMSQTARQRIGNGLSEMTVTPLQVARAYAGLATGQLPRLRLLDTVESEGRVRRQSIYEAEPLPLSRATLERVREGLVAVVRTGTAAGKGLGEVDLGFVMAAKTGSADYKQKGLVPVDPDAPLVQYEFIEGVRKHTWFAGWFPAHDPEGILVVYVHDTSTTSSHSAVHLARQFLEGRAFRGWAREVGFGP